MKKLFTFLAGLFILLINTHLQAQQNASAKDQSLLWRISGNKLTKPSYLFGTIHLICADDYIWTKPMKESLEQCNKVCFEMDLDDPALMTQIAMGLMDHSGKNLEDYFTPAQYILASTYIKDSLGMDISLFTHMKPIALESILIRSSTECNDPKSYEDSIMKTALMYHKEIIGLEKAADQLDVLESIPADTVIKELMDEIQGTPKDNDQEYRQLIETYRKQDLPTLYAMIRTSKDLNNGMDKFLDERNKKWIPQMMADMQKSSLFFAVGAGHLWGDNGVINLLKEQGYKVEPLK